MALGEVHCFPLTLVKKPFPERRSPRVCELGARCLGLDERAQESICMPDISSRELRMGVVGYCVCVVIHVEHKSSHKAGVIFSPANA